MKKFVIHLPSGEAFSPDKTFNCGQCFRFEKEGDFWCGVVNGSYVKIPQNQASAQITYYSDKELPKEFFDSGLSYGEINEKILSSFGDSVSGVIENAVEISCGLRILKQNFFETLISFIISQNNNIPRIKKNVASLCSLCGERFESENKTFYSFPTPQAILSAGEDGLNSCKLGFRTKYILDASVKCASGEISEKKLSALSTKEAKQVLTTIKGVGPKVASCVLLYGLHRLDEVPVDVWMKKVFQKYFGADTAELGEWGGIVQQYLFFRERYIIEGKKV